LTRQAHVIILPRRRSTENRRLLTLTAGLLVVNVALFERPRERSRRLRRLLFRVVAQDPGEAVPRDPAAVNVHDDVQEGERRAVDVVGV